MNWAFLSTLFFRSFAGFPILALASILVGLFDAPRVFGQVGVSNPVVDRKALVVGVKNYFKNPIPEAENDALDVASALQNSGFKTQTIVDPKASTLEGAVLNFASGVHAGDVALFYFSGYGIDVDGRNYLLPVDFNAQQSFQVKYSSLPLDLVVDALRKKQPQSILIVLEACREAPFDIQGLSTKGLASFRGDAITIAYAAAAGRVCKANSAKRNSLFTKQFLDVSRDSSLRVEDVIQRLPVRVTLESQGAQTPFIKVALGGPTPKRLVASQSAASEKLILEDELFRLLQEAPSAHLMANFLADFPQTRYRAQAEKLIADRRSKQGSNGDSSKEDFNKVKKGMRAALEAEAKGLLVDGYLERRKVGQLLGMPVRTSSAVPDSIPYRFSVTLKDSTVSSKCARMGEALVKDLGAFLASNPLAVASLVDDFASPWSSTDASSSGVSHLVLELDSCSIESRTKRTETASRYQVINSDQYLRQQKEIGTAQRELGECLDANGGRFSNAADKACLAYRQALNRILDQPSIPIFDWKPYTFTDVFHLIEGSALIHLYEAPEALAATRPAPIKDYWSCEEAEGIHSEDEKIKSEMWRRRSCVVPSENAFAEQFRKRLGTELSKRIEGILKSRINQRYQRLAQIGDEETRSKELLAWIVSQKTWEQPELLAAMEEVDKKHPAYFGHQIGIAYLKRAVQLALASKDDWQSARVSLGRAREVLDPTQSPREWAEAYSAMALHFYKQRDFEKAMSLYREVVKITPSDPIASRHLGVLLYERAHRAEEAVGLLTNACRPDDPGACADLAEATMGAGRLREAQAQFEKLLRNPGLNSTSRGGVMILEALALDVSGNSKMAREVLKEVGKRLKKSVTIGWGFSGTRHVLRTASWRPTTAESWDQFLAAWESSDLRQVKSAMSSLEKAIIGGNRH